MKTLKLTLAIVLGFIVAACNDENTAKLSSEEQAEMVAASMGKSGFASSSEQSAEHADEAMSSSGRTAACGFTSESSGSLSGMLGNLISFTYAYQFDVALICNENQEPESCTSEFTYEGSIDGPRFASEYSGSGSLTITSLSEANANYEMNGSYDREGSFQSKIRSQASGSSQIDIDIHDVMVNKSSKVIVEGSADALVRGQISGRGSYSFEAHIVFNGDGTATITTGGDTYVTTLTTGEVSAQVE